MRGFKYILSMLALLTSVGMWGQYNPTNPAEPGAPTKAYTLTLQADPTGSCSFNLNATTSQTEGLKFIVQANAAANFTFVSWTEDDEVVSTTARFEYTMPSRNVKLIAHYVYTPGSPTEPSQAVIPEKPVYAPVFLTALPAAGGSFNIASGNNYEVGTTVSLKANPAANFRFVNWTMDGEEVSTANPYNYVMKAGEEANRLVANFAYEPGNPAEPTQRLYRKVFLLSSPAEGGRFNVASGNEYEVGTQQTFIAYNNQWYTFRNWTMDGEEVSTNSSYAVTIPDHDLTLTAHFDYLYDPGNPAEPTSPTTSEMNIYGMTENGVPGQTIAYPVYLENTSEITSMTVVVTFPEGFTVLTDQLTLGQRAGGHTPTVTEAGVNAYRFDIIGTDVLIGTNGKVFEVPVVISPTAVPGESYVVTLSNGARINTDESKTMMDVKNGAVYIQQQREDGLYASFTYDKLQNRFQFTNHSSDKALEWTWDFGDGTTSTERNPMHTYTASGSYDVTLTVNGESGTDVAMMTVLVNDKNTWRVDGTLYLDTEEKGVRYFTSAERLLTFMAASPIASNIKVVVKDGMQFDCELNEANKKALGTIQSQLTTAGYTLTLQSAGTQLSSLCFGNSGDDIDSDVIGTFIAMGQQLVLDQVTLKLWGIAFDPAPIERLKSQTIISGETTAEVSLSLISPDLTFTWTADTPPETISDYTASGTGNIASMTPANSSVSDAQLVYTVVGSKGDTPFLTTTHTITVKPALTGSFTNLKPVNNSNIESTTVTLSWDGITNAVYDVYLWNAANERPATPMAEGITANSFTSANFCQNNKSYKWQVVARNSTQQISSNVCQFTVHLLPNLHVSAIDVMTDLEAGRKATIRWTVRNDGPGDTESQTWTDRLWLIPDVYGGTAQTTCKLLATKSNVQALEAGQEYYGSAEIDLSEEQYGNYFFLVAADMSSVTQIEWDKVGGSIVTPYSPVATTPTGSEYAYLFGNTESSGNKVHEDGETATHSDNFFYKKVRIAMPSMSDEDWNLLKSAYQQMGSGDGWTQPWDFDVERHTVESLPGVSIRGGRVVNINLSNNGLTGSFPFPLLDLTALETLNVSGNQLTGDIGAGMTAFLEDRPTFSSTLRAVNLTDNRLSGNLSLFAQPLTALTTVYAAQNGIAEVQPMLSTNIETLTLDHQDIQQPLTLDINHLSAAALWEQIPSAVLYNHAAQSYATQVRLLCSTDDDTWSMLIDSDANQLVLQNGPTTQNDFRGASGQPFPVALLDASDTPVGHTLHMQFLFSPGDADFNGTVDLYDLQNLQLFAAGSYDSQPFNYTAANLHADDVIDDQDAAALANQLLTIADGGATQPVTPGPEDADATIFMQDGGIWLRTTTPVAAFEITVRSTLTPAVNSALEEAGIRCLANSHDGTVRLVGYTLSGTGLQTGETLLCQLGEGAKEIVEARLLDAAAQPVSVNLDEEEIDTGIRSLNVPADGSPVYDLQGRKVSTPKRGIYIRNGKKIVRR